MWTGDRSSWQRRPGLGFALDRSNQGVTLPGNRRDIATAATAVAEPAPEGTDLEFEIAVLDKNAGPDPRDQLVLANHVAGALGQRDQDIERAAAEADGAVAFQ